MPDASSVPGSFPLPHRDDSSASVLVIENVSRQFGSAPAVDRVSLDIREGEFFSLLGPSGCGKTTLLRMIAGFEQPDAGSIRLDGRDLAGVPPYERPVNLMFQSYALFPHMTVEKNIAYGLKQEKLSREALRSRVEESLALVELEPLARRRPHQLSGGERQRVALARCLAKKPRMLLLDEPLAALDKRLREQMRIELVNIQKRVGTTFIMVTHDQQEAMGVSTRMAVMREGRILQIGSPMELYESPESRFVAEFLGDTNLFEGTLISDAASGSPVLAGVENRLRLRCPGGIGDAEGGRAALAVRPEKLTLSREPPHTELNALRGRVISVGYQGHISIFRLQLPDGSLILATRTNPLRGHSGVEAGDEVYISWPAEAGVLIREPRGRVTGQDAETGR